jgi:hypothetical protein
LRYVQIFLPLFCGVLGFVFGLIAELLYNEVAPLVRSIEIEVEQKK